MAIPAPTSLGSTAGSTNGSSFTHNITSGVTGAGDVLVFVTAAALSQSGTLPTLSMSGGGLTWTKDKEITGTAAALGWAIAQFSAPAPSNVASGTTLTLSTGTPCFNGLIAADWDNGLDTSGTRTDGTDGRFRTSPTTSWDTQGGTAPTTSVADTLLRGGAFADATTTSSVTNPIFELADFQEPTDGQTLTSVYAVLTATGSVRLTGTWAAAPAAMDATVVVAYKGAGGSAAAAFFPPNLSPAALSGPSPDAPPGYLEDLLNQQGGVLLDTVTVITGSDSATATEGTTDVQAAVPGSDASTAADTGTVSATVSASDSGTETDSGTVSATVPGSDSATATDADSTSVTGSGSDTGTGSESSSTFVTLSSSDSATATDAQVSITTPISGSDSATATDSGTASVTAPGSDSGSSTEATSASVTATGTDSSSSTEVGVVAETSAGGDSAAAFDTGVSSVTGQSGDTGSGSEGGTATVTAPGSDSATATDTGTVQDLGATPVSGSDSATATETGALVVTAAVETGPTGGVYTGEVDESYLPETFHEITGEDSARALELGFVRDLTPARPETLRVILPRRRAPQPVVAGVDGAVLREEGAVLVLASGGDAARAGERDHFMVTSDPVGEAEDFTAIMLLLSGD